MLIPCTDQHSTPSPAFSAPFSMPGIMGTSTASQVMTPQAASFLAQRSDLQHTGHHFKTWAAVQAATDSSSAIKLLTRFFGDGATILQPGKIQPGLPSHTPTLARTTFASTHRSSMPELSAAQHTHQKLISGSLPDLAHRPASRIPLALHRHTHTHTHTHTASLPELSKRTFKSLPDISTRIKAAPVTNQSPHDVRAVLLKLSNKNRPDDDLTLLLGMLNQRLMEAGPEAGLVRVAKNMDGPVKGLGDQQARRLLLALEGKLGDSARAITRFAVHQAASAPETVTPALTRLGQCNTLLTSLMSSLNSKLHKSGARFEPQTPKAMTFNHLSPQERNAYSQTLSAQ